MKLEILLIVILSLCTVNGNKKLNGDLLNVEEEGSGSENNGTLNKLIKTIDGSIDDDTENSGDDEDGEGSGSSGEGSGASGEVLTKIPPTAKVSTGGSDITSTKLEVIFSVTTANKKFTPETLKNMTTPITPLDDEFIQKTMVDKGIDVFPDPSAAPVQSQGNKDGTGGVNFTVGIAAGVVVGAVLSILIIVFLVYRLRKKDEGSYSLDEPSSAMLRVDADSTPIKGKDFV